MLSLPLNLTDSIVRSCSGVAPKRPLRRHPVQTLVLPLVLLCGVMRAPVDPVQGAAFVGASAALLVMKWPSQGMSSWRLEVGLAGHLALAMLTSGWYSMEGGPAGVTLGLAAARVLLSVVGAGAVLFSLLELVGREAVVRRLSVEAIAPLQPFVSQVGETLDGLLAVLPHGRSMEASVERAVRRARACRHQLSNLTLVTRNRPLADGMAPAVQMLWELLDPATMPFPIEHVRVERELGTGECMVRVPAPYLELVFWNLADNAFRAASVKGEGTVRVSVKRGAHQLEVTFEDDGPGIETRDADRAMVPLAAPKDGRLHLGLAASKKIAEAYGGGLEVTPRQGGGTVASVRLPQAPQS